MRGQRLVALGSAAHKRGQLAEAESLYRRALAKDARATDALYLLGMLVGDAEEALALLRRAKVEAPTRAAILAGLTDALVRAGRLDEAVAEATLAAAIEPGRASAHAQLGRVRQLRRELGAAVEAYVRALELDPSLGEAQMNLGVALKQLGLLGDAAAALRRAIALRPRSAETRANLGSVLKDIGNIDEAVGEYLAAIELAPALASAHSNLLLALNYTPALLPDEVAAAHREWGERHGRFPAPAPAVRDRSPTRRLRVGYVSPDLREHSVAYFIEAVLEAHDPAQVEVFCYADVPLPDAVTARLARLARWRDLGDDDDARVAERVRADEIDVLVDLCGHLAFHRLGAFARRAAPVQVSWIGYPNTTGVAAMDYRLTDAWADPPGANEPWHSETLVRLPTGFLCYRPPVAAPEVVARAAGEPATFGSFNQLAKISPEVVTVWSAILERVPDARLLLKARGLADGPTRADVTARFAAHGIDPGRLELVGQLADGAAHLAAYGRLDVALDPFPYNGTTTTCEALWMGVPVIVLAGDRHAARVGVSLLAGLGLGELIADSPEAYVELAVALAGDPARRRALAASLRPRVAAAPLTAGPAFTRSLEATYRELWQRWLAQPA